MIRYPSADVGPVVGSISYAGRALGSRLRLTMTGVSSRDGERLWQVVLREFDAVDRALSGFRSDSGVTGLNARAGRPGMVPVDRRLYTAVALADRARRVTGGRFDPRVHEVMRRLGQPGPVALPAPPESAVGSPTPWLRRDPRRQTVAIDEPIDLHGIGKGLALRWAFAALERELPAGTGALLDAGGDLIGRSPGPDGAQWLIGIEDPSGSSEPIAVVGLEVGAVCTSATRITRWVDPDGIDRHHLIDPATRAPAAGGLASVTVAGLDAAWAEIRTKELFFLGRQGIAERARALGLAAWWVDDDGVLEMTPLGRVLACWP